MISRMCDLPLTPAKICFLVSIPITVFFCVTEVVINIISLMEDLPPKNLLWLIVVVTLLYIIGLSAGFYGSIVQKVAYLQVMLFVIMGYLVVKIFVWITTMNSIKIHSDVITHFWFRSSFMASVLSFIFGFVYTLRLKEMENDYF